MKVLFFYFLCSMFMFAAENNNKNTLFKCVKTWFKKKTCYYINWMSRNWKQKVQYVGHCWRLSPIVTG